MEDSYFSIKEPAFGEYKEKGSKFLAYAFPVSNEEEIMLKLSTLKSQHPKARHFCYAYRLGINGLQYRINDDGEPSGTAGKPIYGQILSHEFSDVFVVVVRYFGGTKLGASGLIQAYKQAAAEALDQAISIEKIITDSFLMTTPLSELGHAFFVMKSMHIPVGDTAYKDFAEIPFFVRKSKTNEILLNLKAQLLKIPVEQAASMNSEDWGGFDIKSLE
ncbi:MAG: YigZ family protein [Saprospiraceae bacterium]|nr:YigZ family protein [Saprospiraceae bacterium]